MRVPRCPSCDPTGRGRTCARRRCYCGHPECWAADSYQATTRPQLVPTQPLGPASVQMSTPRAGTWHDRAGVAG